MTRFTQSIFTRRMFLAGAAAGALTIPAIVRAQDRKTAKVSIGRQPYAGGNSPLTQRMINEKMLEKAAAELGYDLTVDWPGLARCQALHQSKLMLPWLTNSSGRPPRVHRSRNGVWHFITRKPRPVPYSHDGAWRTAQHAFGHAAKNESGYSAPPTCAHHDVVGPPAACNLDNFERSIALMNKRA